MDQNVSKYRVSIRNTFFRGCLVYSYHQQKIIAAAGLDMKFQGI